MELNHKILGEGQPIVILHGLFGMLDNWQSVAKMLAEDFMVILIDLRNHGKSPHTVEWGIPIMAEDVREFLEANWIHRAVILGHSMGGKVAMEMALTEPELVEKLIVVDIGPKQYEPGHDIIFKGLQSIDIDQIQNRTEAEEVLSKTIEDWGIRQFLLKNLSRNKSGGYRWKMNLDVIIDNYDSILLPARKDATYDGPALFIRGERSDYILPEDYEEIHATFLQASIETIPEAGHWVHADRKDELVEVVKNFIKL